MDHRLKTVLVGLVAVLALCLAASCSSDESDSRSTPPTEATDEPTSQGSGPHFDGHGADVEKSMFGPDWPLTVSSGRINCIKAGGGVQVVFTSDDDKRYAVNGTARSAAADFGYLDVQEIWADDPDTPGLKIDISPLIDICSPLM